MASVPIVRGEMSYRLILSDPPWQYRNKKTGGSLTSGSEAQYPTLSIEEISALDVPSIAAKDSVLALWSTVPLLPDALQVMGAWGFTYKTLLTWIKLGKLGLGFWFRGNVELLLIGTRGAPTPWRLPFKNVHAEKPTEHSCKPLRFYELLEASEMEPRIELFARTSREGWDAWGLDVPGIHIPTRLTGQCDDRR
jgi:N6-adenosine-specific RNA methylase IME4